MVLRETFVASSLWIREDALPPPFSPPLTFLCLSCKDLTNVFLTLEVSHSSKSAKYFFRVSISVANLSSPKAKASSASFSGIIRAMVLALTIQLEILDCHSTFLASKASLYLGFTIGLFAITSWGAELIGIDS